MAEFVEFRTEEMIPELEQLERLRFFDKNEIRCVAKKRKEFEYKVQRRTKCKEDYLRYIQYEMDLLKLVRLRRSKLGFNQKKSEIDFSIANRVNKLFKQAIFRFQDDIRLWISYIKFCKQVKFYSSVSQMLVQMLRVHSDKPSLWKLAANWEFDENKSVENARQFLLRGLRCHPDSKLLYTEAFRLELVYADLKRKQMKTQDPHAGQASEACSAGAQAQGRADASLAGGGSAASSRAGEDITDQVIAGRLAEVIYKSASKKIHNVTFLISLLNIAKDFSFTHKLQTNIVNDLLNCFPGDELTWDAVARRELAGLCYRAEPAPAELPPAAGCGESMETEESETGAVSSNNNKNTLKERIRRCCAVYLAAVRKHLPTERMWSLYLDMLLEINRDLTHLPKFKKKLLRVAFQAGHNAGLMQEKFYLQWVLLNQGKKKKLSEVLCMATERLPHSLELWQMRLRFHLSEGEEQAGVAVFKQAVAQLGCQDASTLSLWKMMIQYWQIHNMHEVENVFLKGIEQGAPVSLPLKPMFLEWLVISKGIVAARKVYESLNNQPPFCLELHQKMAALECMHPTINLKHVRKCYELACDQFGKNNTDVWMEYVKFEKKKGDPKNASDIYWRAIKNLDPAQKDIFISEYCLVNTGLSEPSQSAI